MPETPCTRVPAQRQPGDDAPAWATNAVAWSRGFARLALAILEDEAGRPSWQLDALFSAIPQPRRTELLDRARQLADAYATVEHQAPSRAWAEMELEALRTELLNHLTATCVEYLRRVCEVSDHIGTPGAAHTVAHLIATGVETS